MAHGNPQKEEGMTPIAHELLEALIRRKINGYEVRIWLAIARKTYGWNQKKDWITASQISMLTGIQRSHVSRTIQALYRANMVTKSGNNIGINKYYSQWKELPNMVHKKSVPNPDGCVPNPARAVPNMVHTKETVTKETIQKKGKHTHMSYAQFVHNVETKNEAYQVFLVDLQGKYKTANIPAELDNFVAYWSERSPGGKKERWQMEKVFDVGRRVATWFRNMRNFSKKTVLPPVWQPPENTKNSQTVLSHDIRSKLFDIARLKVFPHAEP